jgi:hypothetical protein
LISWVNSSAGFAAAGKFIARFEWRQNRPNSHHFRAAVCDAISLTKFEFIFLKPNLMELPRNPFIYVLRGRLNFGDGSIHTLRSTPHLAEGEES